MDKMIAWIITINLLTANAFAAVAPVGAVMPLPANNGMTVPQSAAEKIGIVAAVKGTVTLKNPGDRDARVIRSGQPIYLGDIISTDGAGQLQILLMDQTVFTMGPKSEITIDTFIYDPATADGKLHAEIAQGAFRFVTGKIGRKKPENCEIGLPSGSIGIRGTIVAGKVVGTSSTVILLGPGERTNTGHRIGSFVLKNTVNGKSKETWVNRPGYSSSIENPGSFPSGAFPAPQELKDQIENAILPPEGSGKDNGDNYGDGSGNNGEQSAGERSGQTRIGANIDARKAGQFTRIFQRLNQEAEDSSQDQGDSKGGGGKGGIPGVPGKTSVADMIRLTQVETGVFLYHGAGNFDITSTSGLIVGSMDLDLVVDFGAKTLGGGGSQLTLNNPGDIPNGIVPITTTIQLNQGLNIDLLTGARNGGPDAVYDLRTLMHPSNTVLFTKAEFAFQNTDGKVASTGRFEVTYVDSVITAEGVGNAAPASPPGGNGV